MPSSPEVLEADRGVGGVEVLGEAEPEEQRQADGHVGVTGEVAIDLDGVAVDPQQGVEGLMLGGDAEDGVHDGVGQVAGHHDLLEQAAGYEPERQAGVDLAGVAGLAELGQELRGPHDRAGHQVGEEGEVDRKIQQGCRFDASTVGVDHVAESLEREEADPHRWDQSAARHFHVDAHPAESAGRSFQEEALVLEPGQ